MNRPAEAGFEFEFEFEFEFDQTIDVMIVTRIMQCLIDVFV